MGTKCLLTLGSRLDTRNKDKSPHTSFEHPIKPECVPLFKVTHPQDGNMHRDMHHERFKTRKNLPKLRIWMLGIETEKKHDVKFCEWEYNHAILR